jgi:hypothetical protein
MGKLNSHQYRNWVSIFTIAIMLWNVVGWLGTGLIMNHAHHGDSSHCEISFCFCEIDEGETVCSCHHQTHDSKNHQKNHTSDGHGQEADACYFTDGHMPNTAASQLVFETKQIGYNLNSSDATYPTLETSIHSLLSLPLLDGSTFKLLRPPQV